MNTLVSDRTASSGLVKELYEQYADRLLAYTRRFHSIPEDDAMNVVYRTIYRIADSADRYTFQNQRARTAFVFKVHINLLRNYYRDTRSFERLNHEVQMPDAVSHEPETQSGNAKLEVLQSLLEEMEDWQRMLLLLRGQDMSYSEISVFTGKPVSQLKVYYGRLKKQLLVKMNEKFNGL